MQRNSVGFEKHRKIQRSVPCWEGGRGFEEKMLRCLGHGEGSAEEA